jgi:hypothetical protein
MRKPAGQKNGRETRETGPRGMMGGAKMAMRRQRVPKRKRLRMTAGASTP